ncbi:hypothetical protein MSAS_31320 [Mycobacterium saskatchewanense]|uniref:Transmembrane protein n=1 Tax=Mycobacterium saskatchewanense TaxID=220927 RepID=A0AAJ3TSY8_9MYCO|nr:hypothetical protein [Mycobacterium saskatchewanense]ORW64538.1 hypothetical protein AWC23_24775 [Mycobacterium saskatchewanense]BBX63958.1 hypothetical protein MSAS_31320 [Mycobacterium saskatchewanense]
MARKWFIAWHTLFFVAAGVLYFFCVLPRWYELMGEMPRGLGMAGRIASGALIGLAALPVVFTLLRTRKPELGTPQLALSIRVWSIVAHVLAGILIVGTAISEIWLSLDAAGRYLFAIYGAAAAIGVLGYVAFYLSFVAELPPPPPKPIKAKKPKRRRLRRKKGDDEADEAEAIEESEAEATEESEEPEDVEDAEAADESEESEATEDAQPTEVTAEAADESEAEETADEEEEPRAGLRNRRPTGKGSHRMRRRRTRGGVAVDEGPDE